MKVNKMTTKQIKEKMASLEAGQFHTIKTPDGQEVQKQGGSHSNSKYYKHLAQELAGRVS